MAEEAHRGRDEEGTHDGRVQGDGDGHAQAERLDEHDVGERERGRNDDHDERRTGHDPAAPFQSAGHRLGVVAGPVPDLLHPGQQEDLVVHGQAEQDAEQDDRQGRLHEAKWLESEQGRQVAVLEDPDQRPEARRERERVHEQRLGRQDDRAQEHEQHKVGRDDDEQRRAREVGSHPIDHVGDVGRAATDKHRDARRRRQRATRVAQVRDQRTTLVAVRAEGRVQRECREVAPGGRAEADGHESVARPVRIAIQELVLGQREPPVDVHEAFDPGHPWIRGESTRVVVEGRQIVRRGHLTGRPDGQADRRELTLAELADEAVEGDA